MKSMNQPKETASKSLHSILKTDFIPGVIDREFIAKAFFLPKEILTNPIWKIDSIRVCSGDEWQRSKDYLVRNGASICYDPNSDEIINSARYVGVSIRKHAISGETFVVVKLWYGEGETHQMFAPRKSVTVSKRDPVAAYDRPNARN